LIASVLLEDSGHFVPDLAVVIARALSFNTSLICRTATAGIWMPFRKPALPVLHITNWSSIAVAFPSPSQYSEEVGIDIGIESELIQPKRRLFHSPLTAFR
jgi:hypothetical protein